MNTLENKMTDTLIDLKENYNVIGVKAEFEAEGTRLTEALRLKEIVTKAGLNLTIKIGGCEAIKDMYDARAIGIDTIVAPMIETSYAMKKYVNAKNSVFSKDEQSQMKFMVNIETITGFNNLKDMVSSQDFAEIDGCVLGRLDMTGSLGIPREDVNTPIILDMAKKMSNEISKYNKDFVIGGEVSAESLLFFKQIPYLSKYETRKIIFDASKSLKNSNAHKGILKAVEFELMWLKNKRDIYKVIHDEDLQRLNLLEDRYKKSIEEMEKTFV